MTASNSFNERVRFSLINTPCCQTILCYVNPRMPNYCSECGTRFPGGLHHSNKESILFTDDNAWLRYKEPQ